MEAPFDSDTIWQSVCAKARLALSIIIGNQRLNRGDGREEEDGGHPHFQPGRGGLPHVAFGVAPAEALAQANADAARGGKGGAGAVADADGDPTPAAKPNTPSFRTRIHDTCVRCFLQRCEGGSSRALPMLTHLPPSSPSQLYGQLCCAHAGRVWRCGG